MGKASGTTVDRQHAMIGRHSLGFHGYEMGGGSTGSGLSVPPTSSTPGGAALSARREVVEQLDSEPLLDYLVQNGVLEGDTVDGIRDEASPAKANLALLREVEERGKSAEGLLIIGLRQTGQHYLANLLDESDRIKALSGSGYLSKSRHRGQLSLKVQVRAVKLQPESFKSSTGEILAKREWVSLDDILLRSSTKNGHTPTPAPSVQQLEIADSAEESDEKSSRCLCGCFARLFSSKKSSKKTLEKNHFKSPAVKYVDQSEGSNGVGSVIAQKPVTVKRASSERIRTLDNVFRQKCADFYALISDTASDAHNLLLKYLEQERGLLVLDTLYDSEGVVVAGICTTLQQFGELRSDCTSGKLVADLEKWLVTEDTLNSLGARGLKLNIECPQEDWDLVENEL